MVGILELLFKSSVVQKSKFSFSPSSILDNRGLLFDLYQSRKKTPIAPLETTFHVIAKAAEFNTRYSTPLLEYLKKIDHYMENNSKILKNPRLKDKEKNKIILKAVPLPKELTPLCIEKLGFHLDSREFKDHFNRKGMTLVTAIQLFFASMFILSTAFLATRKASVNLLKKDCFTMSPLDDLYDIVFKQKKTKNSQESIIIRRPIPERVYDWGIQAVEFSQYLENRQGLYFSEDESYLFTECMNSSAFFAGHSTYSSNSIAKGIGKDSLQTLLDTFSDWSEAPSSSNERWYCTPHQLRRVFAVLYFNLTDDSGIEELSWMLGHDALEVTSGYAEVSPDEDWLDLAKEYLINNANALMDSVEIDSEIQEIIKTSKEISMKLNLQIEGVVYEAINQRIAKTGEQVHFKKSAGNNIYFYFSGDNDNG